MVFDASGLPDPGSAAESGGGGEARRPLLGELLIQAKVVTPEQLAEALAAQREPTNERKIGQVLIERGWVTEAQLTQTLSLQLSVPWVSLSHIDFSRQLLNRVPRELAELYCLIPIFVRHVKGQGETLYVAMDDPTNQAALVEVSGQANLPARPMIASATDIRSAIRVYYGEPPAAANVDVPAPPTRAESPHTVREGTRREPPAPPAPEATRTASQPPPRPSQPPRPTSQAPAAPPPAARRPPPAVPRAAHAEDDSPLTARSHPPSESRDAEESAVPAAAAAHAAPSRGSDPDIPRAEGSEPRRIRPRMLSLTLLDGTTLQLPAQKSTAAKDGVTTRDIITALRAAAQGADASQVLGAQPHWEPVVAALLSILLRKGLIADWEFIEELRKL